MLHPTPINNRSILLDTNAEASRRRSSAKISTQPLSPTAGCMLGQPKPQAPKLRSFLSVEKSIATKLSRHNMSNSSFSNIGGRTANASFHLQNSGNNGSFSRNASFAGSSLRLGQNRTSSISSMNDSCSSTSSMNWNGSGVIQMAQRSNGATVKAVISNLKQQCEAGHSGNSDRRVPLEECAMLSLWAVDAYYKVLISKYGGLVAIVTAMKVFPTEDELQASCCSALKHLSNKLAVHQAGGTSALIAAMEYHPQSIQVQSEACEALKNQASLLAQEPVDVLRKLLPLVQHAEQMYLTETGRASAVFLKNLLVTTLVTKQNGQDEEVQPAANVMAVEIAVSR